MVYHRLSHVVLISLSTLALISCNKKGLSGGAKKGSSGPSVAASTDAPDDSDAKPTSPSTPTVETTTDSESSDQPDPIDPSALFQDCETATSSKFVADLVKLEDNIQKLPNFDNLKVIRQVCLNQLNITPRDFEGGFPGVPEVQEYFGLNINFKLNIKKAGEYKFRINSDDGSALYIDGVKLIDNDGRHSPRAKDAKINMTTGAHEMNIRYFQGPRTEIALELMWRAPGDTKDDYIPLELISRP